MTTQTQMNPTPDANNPGAAPMHLPRPRIAPSNAYRARVAAARMAAMLAATRTDGCLP
ncbi:hypothetical protein [Paucibacter soli]|uniref:hypothetical protein n=1 Tax=Paucibacter soli TaxID=3133433 RepID=UPI0030A78F69